MSDTSAMDEVVFPLGVALRAAGGPEYIRDAVFFNAEILAVLE